MTTTRKTTTKTTETKAAPAESRKTAKTVAAPKVASAKTATPAKRQPTSDEIAARAYEKYVARGRAHGYDREDWLAAEAELTR